MTMPVIRDEKANITALAVRTPLRAEETPVRRETTTKTLSGTRKREDSYAILKLGYNQRKKQQQRLTVARCSLGMRVPRSVP